MKAMVAGIGNIFFGDDGFGVQVTQRLARRRLPQHTVVKDFGIRGIHLAYELLEPFDLLVLVDLALRGGKPGTLYVIDPTTDDAPRTMADAHGMDVPAVLAAVQTLGGSLPRVRIVACEPASVDDGVGLSQPVERAVDEAVLLVEELLVREEAQSQVARTMAGAPPPDLPP